MKTFEIKVCADNMQELREKLVDAANSITSYEEKKEIADLHEAQDLQQMYEPTQVDVDLNPAAAPVVREESHQAEVPAVGVAAAPQPVPAQPTNDDNRLDSRGLPWDERIHASTKTTNVDGTWRTRRGIAPALVTEVEMELKARTPSQPVVAAPVQPQAPVAPAIPPVPVAAAPVDMSAYQQASQPPSSVATTNVNAPVTPVVQTQAQPVVVQPDYNPMPPPQTTRPAHSVATFRPQAMNVIAQMIKDKRIDADYINTLKNHFKVAELWDMSDEQTDALFHTLVASELITEVK